MESVAKLKNLAASPRKMRLVANVIRRKEVQNALNILHAMPQKGASHFAKLIRDAMANLKYQHASNKDLLKTSFYIKEAYVDGGPVLKRIRPAARGRAHPIRKPTCHLIVKISPLDSTEQLAPEEIAYQATAKKDLREAPEIPANNKKPNSAQLKNPAEPIASPIETSMADDSESNKKQKP
ncbi:MAG: 50S ribosomal protein L22 [Cytophagales bacterium]